MAEGLTHQGARDDDEIFRLLFVWDINVDLARRLVEVGEVEALSYAMPVQRAGQVLLGLEEHEFGCAPVGGPFPDGPQTLTGTAIDRSLLSRIPDQAFEKPGLMVVWDMEQAETLRPGRSRWRKADPALGTSNFLVDGNHRLARRYLEGDTGTLPCLVIRAWSDVAKFTTHAHRRPASPKRDFPLDDTDVAPKP